MRVNPWLIVSLAIWVGLASCSGKKDWVPGTGGQPTPFRPPQQQEGAVPIYQLFTPTPEPVDTDVVPSPTPACNNLLTFLEDLSIPDGTVTHPGEILDKRWLVQNNGSCNWNEHYRMKLVSGPEMGVPVEQGLYPARSGTQAVIRIEFVSPAETGLQRSAWQAYSPEGQPFGDPFYIEVLVESSPQ
jgi:hypothetical protein